MTVDKDIFPCRTFTHATSVGPCMDVIADGGSLYAIQNREQFPTGRVVKTDADGEPICEARGIGNARQIGLMGDVLVVSAREDGLWILSREDLSVLSHYQTVEFATGVTLCPPFAFISCRQFGVEIIDLTDPESPAHIGLIRVGEVQSACVSDGYLYGGLWGEMSVAVVDIRDLSAPKRVATVELSGRGDGVTVRDGILWAAIGQHRRGIRNVADENDPCYGIGNGYEVFDVRDPLRIRKIRTVYTDKAYYPSFDTWKTYLSGDVLILTDSVLGLYAYRAADGNPLFRLPVSPVHGLPDAVTGAAVLRGKLFVATGRGGLFAVDTAGRSFEPFFTPRDYALRRVPPHPFTGDTDKPEQVFYAPGTSVLGLCRFGDGLALACGKDGFVLTDRSLREIGRMATDGFCRDVGSCGSLLVCAESDAGLSVWQNGEEGIGKIASLSFDVPVTQLFCDPAGRYVLVCGGSQMLYAVSLRDLPALRVSAVRNGKQGPLYGDNFASHTLRDGTALLFWHRDGLVTYHPDRPDVFSEYFYPCRTGFTGFGPGSGIDTDGEKIYYGFCGGFVLLPLRENAVTEDLERVVPETPVRGKFILSGKTVIACERAKGEITGTDISDPQNPRVLFRIRTNATVGKPFEWQGDVLIPAAHHGLLRLKRV